MRPHLPLAALCLAALAACSVKPVTFTPDDGQRAEDCDTPGDEDGNGTADCADPACAAAPACQPACGNAAMDPGEECDDGNLDDGDACEASCTLPACGNHIVDSGEQCDDGNLDDNDDCRSDCVANRCGDGFVDTDGTRLEECDGAPPAGTGDRTVIPTETATCDLDCTLPACGDGKLNGQFIPSGALGPEQCDTGTAVSDQSDCTAACQINRCGDGHVDVLGPDHLEGCDDGSGGIPQDSPTCDADCTLAACGDGRVNTVAGEQCDDGNTVDGDGCDSCRVAACTINLVPAMTSPTSPSGVVSRSGAFDTSFEAWQAFDSSRDSMWISAEFETPAWIAYQWGDGPRNVTSYAITFVNGSSLTSRAPRDWTFEGWDGSVWNVLDTRNAQTNWLGLERRTYTVASPGNYSMYRLNVSDDNDARAGVVVISMGALEFMGCPPLTVDLVDTPSGHKPLASRSRYALDHRRTAAPTTPGYTRMSSSWTRVR